MVSGQVRELTEMWEARITLLNDQTFKLKEKIKELEEKNGESPGGSNDQRRNERMDLKMIEGIPNWNGPHQQLFLEWAWGFHVNLNAVKRGLGRAAKWACKADTLEVRIADRDPADFPKGVMFEEVSENLIFYPDPKIEWL